MKLAYLLYLDVEKYDGVTNKVVTQIETWVNQGNEVALFCIVPKLPSTQTSLARISSITTIIEEEKVLGASAGLLAGWFKSDKVQKLLINKLAAYNPDLVYYRNTAYSSTIRHINKRFITVCEINTLEQAEYKLQRFNSVKYLFRYLHYTLLHRFAFNEVNGVVGVTHEITDQIKKSGYKSHTAVVPNSINVSDYLKPKTIEGSPSQIPKLVFIGTPGMSWHGVDRIIKIAESTLSQLEFHIIGYSKGDFDNPPPNVKFYGVLPSGETYKVISTCHIGIGTMALFRKEMEEACPLKVRECLSYGLPMILGYEDTAFITDSATRKANYPDYVLKLSNQEEITQEDVNKVVDFCYKYRDTQLTFEDVAPFIDVHLLETKRLEFLKRVYGSTRG
ncbi:glycosyltransferase family protein [Pontibacter lucknowensis]|uniref:Glycosyltransferase involved in cell wall bisynthesis n=1 Tax=Pontibacter lucknowensis TaxID=1077936 RepID=A0A1N7ATR6_9BACT|nr:glycosyltransferase [Pontibacter lucknowensis]SIR42416.1 Glycosyltransferase involved in cell wall bisynthesis [Pontibacter lucknowensis]